MLAINSNSCLYDVKELLNIKKEYINVDRLIKIGSLKLCFEPTYFVLKKFKKI